MAYKPNSLAARDVAYILHPYTSLAAHLDRGPMIITRGEGIYVYDEDDNRYIEGLAGLWCTGLGLSQNRLIDAAVRQMKVLPFSHTFAHRSSEPVIELAEKLIEMTPDSIGKVYLVNSGSEAVDTAMKMVWYYNNALDRPEKKKIISRLRAYHGVTIASGSLTALPYVQKGWDLPIDRILHTDAPCYYRGGQPGESEEAFATRLAESLDTLIEDEGADTVAAFIAEPVMGAGGVVPPPATYFEKVQKVLKKHDVLMIADEVICGFGRTGNMFGCDTYNIRPDIMTLAKQLSSAYLPIGATLVSDEIFAAFVKFGSKVGVFGTGNTYGGHPVPAAVAVETLKIYEDDDILGHVRNVVPHFQKRLRQLGAHPLVGNARGVGLIGGLEIVADKETKESFSPKVAAAAQVAARIQDNGVIVRPLPSDTIGICPPLIITESQIDELFDGVAKGLDDATAALSDAA